jgi:protein-tyrosine-phosphatase
MEPSHIFWIRRHFPEIASRTGTLPRLIRHLPEEGDIETRIAAMGLAEVEIEDWEEVVDPAGGDQEIFDRCAEELERLVSQLVAKIS